MLDKSGRVYGWPAGSGYPFPQVCLGDVPWPVTVPRMLTWGVSK